MLQIPDSSTFSTANIASYITSNIDDQGERIYAIFSWITENIQYDVKNMFSIDFYQPNNDIVKSVLVSQTGICLHYSKLFEDIANKIGIKTYVVQGYTKQNGLIDHIPHAWCASLLDSSWYLFDPAWGSGYFKEGGFHKQRNLKYFKVSPAAFIKTHMPFDPVWQFLFYPVTNRDFYNHHTEIDENKPFFNYSDSIRKYEYKSEIERMEASVNRIKQNDITNVLIYREIKYLSEQILIKKYNVAVNHYNDGIILLNRSIMVWNEFKPDKNTETISELLDSAEYSITLCEFYLSTIKDPSGFIKTSVNQLYSLLEIAERNISDLRESVTRYLNSRHQ